MPHCVDSGWTMTLVVDNSSINNRFTLQVKVNAAGDISGYAFDDNQNRTTLSGNCRVVSAAGQRPTSLMHFRFIAKAKKADVEIVLGGMAWEQADPALPLKFKGGFIALRPAVNDEEANANFLPFVVFDEGDTGTGTGTTT